MGAYYHLLSRGNEGRDIFAGEDDRGLFLDTLGECCERFELAACYIHRNPLRVGLVKRLAEGCQIAYDLSHSLAGRRLAGVEKGKRDLLICWVWKDRIFSNAEIGKPFALTYSAVTHIVQGVTAKWACDREARSLFEDINSQYKLGHQFPFRLI